MFTAVRAYIGATALVLSFLIGLPCVHGAPTAINVAFHSSTNTANAMAPEAAPVQQGTLVDTSRDLWNNVVRGQVGMSFTNFSLLDSASNNSGTMLTLTAGYIGTANNNWTNKSKDYVMMEGWYGFKANETLTVSNLPPVFTTNGYHVVIYGDCNSTSRVMNYTIEDSTRTINDTGTFAGDFAPFMAAIPGLSNSTFTIHGNPTTNDNRSAINGLRIIAGPWIPPPSLPQLRFFKATPSRVAPGLPTTLRWEVTNASSIVITPGIGNVTALTTNGAGCLSLGMTNSTVFCLAASNDFTNFVVTAIEHVAVGPPVPNLLLFLVDNLGWVETSVPFYYTNGVPAITPLNQRFRTPTMEILAARGMKFTAAVCSPVCSPSRTSLMTGKNTARHHVTDWLRAQGDLGPTIGNLQPPSGWRRTGIAQTEATLPQLLAQAGYHTIHVGKGHFGSIGAWGQFPQNIGFDVNIAGGHWGHQGSYYGTNNFKSIPPLTNYYGSNIFLTEALTLEMRKELVHAAEYGSPFFACMSHHAVHAPLETDPRFAAHYPGLTNGDLGLATMIEGMDKSLADLLGELEALGVAENTLVVFMSDNGAYYHESPLRELMGTVYENGIRVPMIWAWAKTNALNSFQAALPIMPGSRQTDLVFCWDVFATLLSAAGVTVTNRIDGWDLSGYLRSTPGFHRPQHEVIHYPHHRTMAPASVCLDGDWRLIYNYQSNNYELYDLAVDIGQTNNVALARPERVMAMARAMARELQGLDAQFPEYITNGAPVPLVMPNLPAVDTDTDGLPDLVEDSNANGCLDPGETDPDNSDTDGDGTPDGAEVRTGTDPLDPASNFVAFLTVSNGIPAILSWPSKTGAVYRVERSPALLPTSWTVATDNVPGQDGTTFLNLPTDPSASNLFYRVLLK